MAKITVFWCPKCKKEYELIDTPDKTAYCHKCGTLMEYKSEYKE